MRHSLDHAGDSRAGPADAPELQHAEGDHGDVVLLLHGPNVALERVLEQPHTYTIGETNYLLIELSNYSVPTRLSECFTRLGDRGLTPILTHPERNPILQQSPQRILEWAEQGCLIQVTASALTGFWGERPEIVARWLLDRSAVHILASDAHDTKRRIPNLSAARAVAEKILGAEYAGALVEGNPGAVVNGMPIPYCPRPVLD